MGNLIRTLIFVLFVSGSFAQIAFYKFYSDNGNDFGQGIVQLADSSYIVTGASSSFAEGPSDAFLLKIDSLGNYIWSFHYGGPESDWGRRVLHKPGFGFFLCGYSNSFGNGAYDYYLSRIDEQGDQQWFKTYGGSGWEKLHDAALTPDTGVIMVGENRSNATDNKDIYIVRTDSSGNVLWTKTIGAGGHDYASTIKSFDDTMFVVAGQIYVEDSSLYKAFMMNIDWNGNIYWTDTLGDNGNYGINDFSISGNEIDAVGYWNGPGSDDDDIFYWNADLNGIVNYTPFTISVGINQAERITTYGNPGMRYVVYSLEDAGSYPNGPDLQVARYTNGLDWVEGAALVAYANPDVSGEFIPTNDGGAILVGYTSSSGFGGNNVYVLKIGPNQLYPNTLGEPDVEQLVWMNELNEEIKVSVYPNPVSDNLSVNFSEEMEGVLQIYSISGKLLVKRGIEPQMNVDTVDFESGLYFITIQSTDGKTGSLKFVKR